MNIEPVKQTVNVGLSLGPLLFLTFVILIIGKLAGWATIPWWLVTLPLWIWPSILICMVLLFSAIALFFLVVGGIIDLCTGR